MGLNVSHGCWNAPYSAFMRWRTKIAEVAGLPPLSLMEGFYHPDDDMGAFCLLKYSKDELMVNSIQRKVLDYLPISWDCLKPSALHELLHHSDCDGSIKPHRCRSIANALEELLPKLKDEDEYANNFHTKTKTFIDGLRKAAKARQTVQFG